MLLGAAGTGKSRLAATLSNALQVAGREVEVIVAGTAIAARASTDALTLLMGLDTPGGGQEAADAALRTALSEADIPYLVLYGSPDERLAVALDALENLLAPDADGPPPRPAPGATAQKAWVWACDKCSDPQCEHRLLTDLLARRSEAA